MKHDIIRDKEKENADPPHACRGSAFKSWSFFTGHYNMQYRFLRIYEKSELSVCTGRSLKMIISSATSKMKNVSKDE
jgi:hypothetical protein